MTLDNRNSKPYAT